MLYALNPKESVQYFSDRKIRVLAFTWNVGNKMPLKEELPLWCPLGGADFDLVVIGTQENSFAEKKKKKKGEAVEEEAELDDDEVVESMLASNEDGPSLRRTSSGKAAISDLSKKRESLKPDLGEDEAYNKALSLRLDRSKRSKYRYKARTVWDDMVAERLGKGYVVVKHVVLWEMRLTVYAKAELMAKPKSKITHVQAARSATGIGGVLGNKGGLIIKLNFGQTTLCFAACHLAAHSHKWRDRDDNFFEVLRDTMGDIGNKQLDVLSEFDHIFWMGDLNYRIDFNMRSDDLDKCVCYAKAFKLSAKDKKAKLMTMMGPSTSPLPYPTEEDHLAKVKELLAERDWAALMENDQLRASQRNGRSFVGFEEGEPSFPPTFKVERCPGMAHKDQRIPSYCDRILWHSMPTKRNLVKQTFLASVPDVSTSDHKPVCAHFEITPSPFVHKLTSSHAIQVGLAVTHPQRGHGRITKIEETGEGKQRITLYHVEYEKESTVHKYRPESLHKLMVGHKEYKWWRKPMTLDFLSFSGAKARQRLPCPLLQFSFLEVRGLRDADLGGGSDPYLIFHTNPPNLLTPGDDAPISSIKRQIARSRVKNSAEIILSRSASRESSARSRCSKANDDSSSPALNRPSKAEQEAVSLHMSTNVWKSTELPLLRPNVASSSLEEVTLIISVYDFDAIGRDDPLGCVSVPLTPTREGSSYVIKLEDLPLRLCGRTHDTGTIKGKLKVYHSDALEEALVRAHGDGAGKNAMTYERIRPRWYQPTRALLNSMRIRRMQAESLAEKMRMIPLVRKTSDDGGERPPEKNLIFSTSLRDHSSVSLTQAPSVVEGKSTTEAGAASSQQAENV